MKEADKEFTLCEVYKWTELSHGVEDLCGAVSAQKHTHLIATTQARRAATGEGHMVLLGASRSGHAPLEPLINRDAYVSMIFLYVAHTRFYVKKKKAGVWGE